MVERKMRRGVVGNSDFLSQTFASVSIGSGSGSASTIEIEQLLRQSIVCQWH